VCIFGFWYILHALLNCFSIRSSYGLAWGWWVEKAIGGAVAPTVRWKERPRTFLRLTLIWVLFLSLTHSLSPRTTHVTYRFGFTMASATPFYERPKPHRTCKHRVNTKLYKKQKEAMVAGHSEWRLCQANSDILARPSLAPSVPFGTVLLVLVFSAADSQGPSQHKECEMVGRWAWMPTENALLILSLSLFPNSL
jgi:hypothetical protein